jgi:hydroxypyruvate reductase
MNPEKSLLEKIFLAAVAAVEPGRLVREALRRGPEGITLASPRSGTFLPRGTTRRIHLVGGGKAGRAMGEAAAEILGEEVAAGVLAVPRGSGGIAGPVRYIEAGHPLPDEGSRAAAQAMLDLLSSAGEGDLVVALISGGGSAMISAPPEGVSPGEKEAVLRLLLASGADIADFNTVRRHLSRVKGGLMARAAHPATVWALLMSDVPGDDPSVIASGPFSPDPTGFDDAMRVLIRHRLCQPVPNAARRHIEAGLAGAVPETPKPGDPLFARVSCVIAGSNRVALDFAVDAARRDGAYPVRVLPGFLRGEARECARSFVAEMRSAAASPGPPVLLIAGGETTVTVSGKGKGGRNQEFALSAAVEMDGEPGMAVLSCGTDGVDGPTDAAGAFADGSTCARAAKAGLSPRGHLERNDAYPFFRALSDLVVTGPTGTNVADIAIGLATAGTKSVSK